MSTEPPVSGTADVGGGGRSVTVLVADDNDVALRLCRRVLQKAGYKVLTAADGLEAVSVALANSPDVILMDVAMPGIDGLEATRRIKQQRPRTAIVIASVLATASNRERFLAAGADHVMMKPFRLSDMIVAIATVTANRGPQMKNRTGARLDSYESVERKPDGGMAGVPTHPHTSADSLAKDVLHLVRKLARPARFFARLFDFVRAIGGTNAEVQRQTLLKEQTLDLALQAIDARDRYTASHSIRVSELAGRLAEQLELGDREVELLRTAGSLHDLGMIGIPDYVLKKAGRLNDDEWAIMRRHPDIGADMLAQHASLAEIAPIVRHHHERWDGSGYPAGLKGDVIPFGARILSVADEFDAITGPQFDLKARMTPIEALEDISRHADRWYDPNVVDALRKLHGLKPLDGVNRPEVPRRVSTLRIFRTSPGFNSLITSIGISALGGPLTQVATLVSIYLATFDPRFVALAFIVQALGTVVISSFVGGLTDRVPRRGLVSGLELAGAAMLLATPFLIGAHSRWWLIYPVLVFLACINAIVQPARQAAIPSLVPAGQVRKANAIVAATSMLAGAIGFGFAGAILALSPARSTPNMLFVADAITFVLAAAIVFGIPSLGGGTSQASVSGALRRSWSVVAARPHLVIGTLAAFFIPISYPALLALAYQSNLVGLKAAANGGQTYSTLELLISIGIFVGSIIVARLTTIGTMRTVGAGLFLTGVYSVVIAMSSSLPLIPPLTLIAAALFIASIGNPIYAVANQTAILEATDPSNRGSIMATRFGLVQTASVVGVAVGGIVTEMFGAAASYGVLGAGLVLLAAYAFGVSPPPIKVGGALSS